MYFVGSLVLESAGCKCYCQNICAIQVSSSNYHSFLHFFTLKQEYEDNENVFL